MQKSFAVVVGHKHHVTAIAPGHHMINRSGILETNLPSHVETLKEASDRCKENVKMCTLTPFTDPIYCLAHSLQLPAAASTPFCFSAGTDPRDFDDVRVDTDDLPISVIFFCN